MEDIQIWVPVILLDFISQCAELIQQSYSDNLLATRFWPNYYFLTIHYRI